MRRYDLISSLFWLLCSALIIIGSLRLAVGTMGNPGPGFMPLLIGLLLSIISILLFIRSLKQSTIQKNALGVEKNGWYKVVTMGIALLIYAVTLPRLGFLFITFVLMVFLFKAAGEMKWKTSLGGAILTTSLFYILFKICLKVQLPLGPWGM
jgi:hypothetical protein